MAAAITAKLTSRLEGKTVDVQRPSISNSSVSSQIPLLSPSGGDTIRHNHNAPGSAFLDSFLGVTHTSFPLPQFHHRERGQNLGRISPAYAEGAGSRCRLPQRTRGPNANFLRTPFLWSACELFFILGLSVL